MAFTCPRCGRTSHHPTDEAEGYCGACHDWTRLAAAVDELRGLTVDELTARLLTRDAEYHASPDADTFRRPYTPELAALIARRIYAQLHPATG
jgi:hypothetical protein